MVYLWRGSRDRIINEPSLEKISGGTTASQLVLTTLQLYARCSTIISPSTLTEAMMRKPRDFDAELKALGDEARDLRNRKVQQLGELVIATGADTLSADELAGALIVLAETSDTGKREAWGKRRTAPPTERYNGGARAQPGGAQPSTGGKGAA